MIRELKIYPSNLDQASAAGKVPANEQIGEGVPVNNSDGSCSHDYLFPNFDKTTCVLPQRVDVGRHYISTGGLDGKKESYADLMSRVSSFGRYTFVNDADKLPSVVKRLFFSEEFQTAAKSICPAHLQHLDPFQYNFIMQVPGQTVAAHLDATSFWGATREDFPQWLLVAMKFSGLFERQFIDQIQVVGYLHEWQKTPADSSSLGGEFVYYSNETSVTTVQPLPLSGIFLDGTKLHHAAKVFRPDVKAPVLNKDKRCLLKYIGSELWHIACDGEVVQTYQTSELRMSIVYRARCFKDAQEQQKFYTQGPDDKMKLNTILETLVQDMVGRGVVTAEGAAALGRLDLAMLIMDTYVRYPLPPLELALVPFNYCAIPRLLKWTKPFFDLIC